MAEPVEVNEVIQVTGLTPSTPAAPEPEPSAAPSEQETASEAQPSEEPAALEEVSRETEGELSTAPAPAAQSGEAPKKPARGVQKALDRLTREREEARLQSAQLAGVVQTLLAQQQARQQPQQVAPAAQVATNEQAPDRKDYPDWEQFNRATAQHEARKAADQVVKQQLGQFVRALAGQQQFNLVQQQAAAKVARVEQENAKAATRFGDWDDVRANEKLISPALYNAIAESPDPTLVMHHLHVNPDEHDKLMSMTPSQQLMAVGAIVASANTQSRVSNAPAPARPVAAVRGGQGGSQYTENMSPEQHKQWAKRQGVDRGLK